MMIFVEVVDGGGGGGLYFVFVESVVVFGCLKNIKIVIKYKYCLETKRII